MKTELAIGALAAAYGSYVTWARITNDVHLIGIAELVGSSGAVIFGHLVDSRGGWIPALGVLAIVTSIMSPQPILVALTLFFFYAPYIAVMLEASKDIRLLSRSVASLSVGWMVGVAFPHLAPYLIAIGVLLSLKKVQATRVGFLDAVDKLIPLLIPLIIFTSAEYMAYVIVTRRFYELAKTFEEFYFWYALLPGVTSAIGSLVAPLVIRRLGTLGTLKFSILLYVIVIYLSVFANPILCYIAWAFPAYALFEISLIRLVSEVSNASGAALGVTYTTMSLSSVFAPLIAMENELIVVLPVVSYVIMWIEEKVGFIQKTH